MLPFYDLHDYQPQFSQILRIKTLLEIKVNNSQRNIFLLFAETVNLKKL